MWPFRGKNKGDKGTGKKDDKGAAKENDVKSNAKENKKDKKVLIFLKLHQLCFFEKKQNQRYIHTPAGLGIFI